MVGFEFTTYWLIYANYIPPRGSQQDREAPYELHSSEGCSPPLAFATIKQKGVRAVKFYTFEIVVEKEPEDEGYLAYSPTLPVCFSNGRTVEEASRNIREAVQQHIESLLAQGQQVPQNENLVHIEELTVGVPG